jgi:hypothetical protein
MKKVRYMIGAAGVLAMTPAFGAVIPPAASAAVTAHTSVRHSGKTVSLNQRTTPAIVCPGQSTKRAHSGTGVNKFSVTAVGAFAQLTPCIGFTGASLAHRQNSLKLRVRTYLNGVEKSWGLTGGHQPAGDTVFSKTLNAHASKVCDALVYESATKVVAYGPVCINL